MKAFHYIEPKTVEEAVAALSKCGDEARLLAGGTNLVPGMRAKQVAPKCVVNLKTIEGLGEIHEDAEGVHIGALVTLADLAKVDVPRRRHVAASMVERLPLLLRSMISLMANPQVRNIATLPGNLAWGSPAADSAPPLLALEARMKVQGPDGERNLELDEFFIGPGQTHLKSNEVITEILIPADSLTKAGSSYKLMKRKANTLAVCSAAVAFNRTNGRSVKDVRVAVGAVAPTPLRIKKVEALLEGQTVDEELLRKVKEMISAEVAPITDLRSTSWYRKEVMGVLVERCITEALA